MRGIDVHAHFVPRGWLDRVAAGEWSAVAGVEGELVRAGLEAVRLSPRFSDLEAATRDVRLRLLSIPPPMMGYEAPAAAAADYCAAFNDALAAETALTDAALPLATLPLQDPESAAAELRRTRALGFAGAQIGARVGGLGLDAPELRPVLRAAQETGALLLVHPSGAPADTQLRRPGLEPVVAWPLQTTVAAVSLIFGGVLAELERLNLVLAHGGGTLPFLLGRLDCGHEVRAELRAAAPLRPSDYANRFYYDSVVFRPAELRFLVGAVGASRVLLGSDYPFPLGLADPVGALEAAGLEPDESALIAEGNATVLLDVVHRKGVAR